MTESAGLRVCGRSVARFVDGRVRIKTAVAAATSVCATRSQGRSVAATTANTLLTRPATANAFSHGAIAPCSYHARKVAPKRGCESSQPCSSGELRPKVEPYRFMSLISSIAFFHFASMTWLALDVPVDPWSQEY